MLELAGQAKKGDVSDWIGDGWRCCGCRPAPVVRRAGHRRRCRAGGDAGESGPSALVAAGGVLEARVRALRRGQARSISPSAGRSRRLAVSNFAPRAKRRARTVGPRARSARARRRSPGGSPFLDVDDVAAALAKRAEKRAHRRGAIASASERAQARVTDGTEDSRKMSLLLLASENSIRWASVSRIRPTSLSTRCPREMSGGGPPPLGLRSRGPHHPPRSLSDTQNPMAPSTRWSTSSTPTATRYILLSLGREDETAK